MLSKKNKNVAVIVAAGNSTRMGKNINKQFLIIDKKPLLSYSLLTFEKLQEINSIIIVAKHKEISLINELLKEFNITKVKSIISGGETRQESVKKGLFEIEHCKTVLIHDGARPFASFCDLKKMLKIAKNHAVSFGLPLSDAVKNIKEYSNEEKHEQYLVSKSILHEKCWTIQTPQAFPFELIKPLHENNNTSFVDDTALVENRNQKIILIRGSIFNIKITYPEDIEEAENIAKIL